MSGFRYKCTLVGAYIFVYGGILAVALAALYLIVRKVL